MPEPGRISPSPAPHPDARATHSHSGTKNLLSPCHPQASAPRTSAFTSCSAHAASWEPEGPGHVPRLGISTIARDLHSRL